ncbi:MAG TPA: type II toxin-antitoxin system RelE/ParE family toxin [Pseudolabrys sp.]|nr:type II toxin-antitoxin system RelE/ParE family toxin [Pseudolabrys sp.]
MKLVISHAAAADLQRLRLFLADKNPAATQRAIAGLIEAIDSLATFPGRTRASGVSGLRDLIVPFGRSAYVVRFAHDPAQDETVIIRIWHGREARSP